MVRRKAKRACPECGKKLVVWEPVEKVLRCLQCGAVRK